MSGVPCPPAPNLSPDEYCTWFEFEHAGTDTFEGADHA